MLIVLEMIGTVDNVTRSVGARTVFQTRRYPCASRKRSASRAAMQPVPAAVTAWR